MLTVNQPVLELGKLKYGKPYQFTYTLTNTSDRPVKILRLAVGCTSCTKARVLTHIIQPNACGTLEVTFTPGSIGAQVKSIDVIYDSGVLKLKFKAESYA